MYSQPSGRLRRRWALSRCTRACRSVPSAVAIDVNHFGPKIAADLRKRRPKPHATWHLDEVYLKIDGRMVYLWRAVDAEGEVLDVLVQTRRNKRVALKLMRKLLKKYGFVPDKLVTDDLRSYGAAANDIGIARRHERGRLRNNRAEICISRPDEGRGRCKGSRAWDPRKDFSQCMQQHKIPRQKRTEPSGHRPCRHGVKSSLLREPEVPGDLLRAIFGNVTEPCGGICSARDRQLFHRPDHFQFTLVDRSCAATGTIQLYACLEIVGYLYGARRSLTSLPKTT
jgi:hypothetical protein